MLVSVTVQVEIGPQASLDELEQVLVEAGREGMRRGLRMTARRLIHCAWP